MACQRSARGSPRRPCAHKVTNAPTTASQTHRASLHARRPSPPCPLPRRRCRHQFLPVQSQASRQNHTRPDIQSINLHCMRTRLRELPRLRPQGAVQLFVGGLQRSVVRLQHRNQSQARCHYPTPPPPPVPRACMCGNSSLKVHRPEEMRRAMRRYSVSGVSPAPSAWYACSLNPASQWSMSAAAIYSAASAGAHR